MKTIGFKLAKRLKKAGLMEYIETEYGYAESGGLHNYKEEIEDRPKMIKTLTLEEAIEFLPNNTLFDLNIEIFQKSWKVYGDTCKRLYLNKEDITLESFEGETLLEVIEKMLIYLLDNNLIGPKKK